MITGVTDLSEITDRLLAIIRTAISTVSPGLATASGSMPESVRKESGCQLSLYLFHIAVDKNVRNTPVTGPQIERQRPLGLELHYLLTSFAGADYVKEQFAMAIAMRALHDNAFLRLGGTKGELSIGLESEGIDRLGVLWQAVSAPFRCTAIYRAAVAFLAPGEPAPAVAPPPKTFTLTADPSELPFADTGQLLGSFIGIDYLHPDSTVAQTRTAHYDLSPAVAAAGQRFFLFGAGLNVPGTDRLYLVDAAGTESDVTAWRDPNAALHTSARIAVLLPSAPPPAGVYQLRAGGPAASQRTNGVPFSIAAGISGVSNPPLLTFAGAPLSFQGNGFVPGSTQVLLETVVLAESGVAPNAGEFQIGAGGTSFSLLPPNGLPSGRYAVRVRVNQVESAPSWWMVMP